MKKVIQKIIYDKFLDAHCWFMELFFLLRSFSLFLGFVFVDFVFANVTAKYHAAVLSYNASR